MYCTRLGLGKRPSSNAFKCHTDNLNILRLLKMWLVCYALDSEELFPCEPVD